MKLAAGEVKSVDKYANAAELWYHGWDTYGAEYTKRYKSSGSTKSECCGDILNTWVVTRKIFWTVAMS